MFFNARLLSRSLVVTLFVNCFILPPLAIAAETRLEDEQQNLMRSKDTITGATIHVGPVPLAELLPYLNAKDILTLRLVCKSYSDGMKDNNLVWKHVYLRDKALQPLLFEMDIKNWKLLFATTNILQRQLKTLHIDSDLISSISTLRSSLYPIINGEDENIPPLWSFMRASETELSIMKAKDQQQTQLSLTALQHYLKAADQYYAPAQQWLNFILQEGQIAGQAITVQERRTFLETEAKNGSRYAQEYLDLAHCIKEPLNYLNQPQDNFFAQLWERYTSTDEKTRSSARNGIAHAIAYQRFVYATPSFTFHHAYGVLHDLESQHVYAAHQYLNRLLYGAAIGDRTTEQSYYNALLGRADTGSRDAQQLFYSAIFNRDFNFKDLAAKKCFELLLKAADEGDSMAQAYVNQAYYKGILNQRGRKTVERWNALLQREARGDSCAKRYIADAIYEGKLGQNVQSDKDRFQALLQRALHGESQAQTHIYTSIKNGSLGQKADPTAAHDLRLGFMLLNVLTGSPW